MKEDDFRPKDSREYIEKGIIKGGNTSSRPPANLKPVDKSNKKGK
ncbi:MAG: hypothetical protein WBG46_13135 [Nonlabens sp.]